MTPRDEDTIVQGLVDGYGVEDISVDHGLAIEAVRAMVAEMRKDGTLALIYEPPDEEDDEEFQCGRCYWRGRLPHGVVHRCPACERLTARPIGRWVSVGKAAAATVQAVKDRQTDD